MAGWQSAQEGRVADHFTTRTAPAPRRVDPHRLGCWGWFGLVPPPDDVPTLAGHLEAQGPARSLDGQKGHTGRMRARTTRQRGAASRPPGAQTRRPTLHDRPGGALTRGQNPVAANAQPCSKVSQRAVISRPVRVEVGAEYPSRPGAFRFPALYHLPRHLAPTPGPFGRAPVHPRSRRHGSRNRSAGAAVRLTCRCAGVRGWPQPPALAGGYGPVPLTVVRSEQATYPQSRSAAWGDPSDRSGDPGAPGDHAPAATRSAKVPSSSNVVAAHLPHQGPSSPPPMVRYQRMAVGRTGLRAKSTSAPRHAARRARIGHLPPSP
jgi:hypothetical protein